MRIGIVGRGKLGSALEKALSKAGHEVVMDVLTSELIILCVPDDAIADVSRTYPDFPMVHTSGANPASVIHGNGPKASMHPIQTVKSGAQAEVFEGIVMSLEGDEELLKKVARLVTDVGATPLFVTPNQKTAIHTAAVIVSNFTIALHMVADRVLRDAGLNATSADLFEKLTDQTISNLREVGALDARTGPALRGDIETMRKHLALLEGHPSEIAVYKALSEILAVQIT